MMIRELDYAYPKNEFNMADENDEILKASKDDIPNVKAYGIRPGPGTFSWLCNRKLDDKDVEILAGHSSYSNSQADIEHLSIS